MQFLCFFPSYYKFLVIVPDQTWSRSLVPVQVKMSGPISLVTRLMPDQHKSNARRKQDEQRDCVTHWNALISECPVWTSWPPPRSPSSPRCSSPGRHSASPDIGVNRLPPTLERSYLISINTGSSQAPNFLLGAGDEPHLNEGILLFHLQRHLLPATSPCDLDPLTWLCTISTSTILLGGTPHSLARAGGMAEHLSSMSRERPYLTGVLPSWSITTTSMLTHRSMGRGRERVKKGSQRTDSWPQT